MSMNFATAGQQAVVDVEKNSSTKQLTEVKQPQINRNFKKDVYKKSLQVANYSNIALPIVDPNKHQLNASFDVSLKISISQLDR